LKIAGRERKREIKETQIEAKIYYGVVSYFKSF
jgi:hypothetical protein